MIFFRKARKPSKQRAEELKEELDTLRHAQTPADPAADTTTQAATTQANAGATAEPATTLDTGTGAETATEARAGESRAEVGQAKDAPLAEHNAEPLANYTKEQFLAAKAILESPSSVELAKRIAVQTAGDASGVGEHLESVSLEDGIVAHFFAAKLEGYIGWKWAVVLTLLPDQPRISVSESVLLPGKDSLLAPDWVPFKDRLKPADMTELDEIEYAPDDERLEVLGLLKKEDLKTLENLALERNRVLNAYGKEDLAVRWYEGTHGPFTASTRIAGATCMSCAFYVPLSGDLGQLFGACANAWSRDDGRVVSADHGCGMHSETDVSRKVKRWNPVDSAINQFDNVDIDTDEDLDAIDLPEDDNFAQDVTAQDVTAQ